MDTETSTRDATTWVHHLTIIVVAGAELDSALAVTDTSLDNISYLSPALTKQDVVYNGLTGALNELAARRDARDFSATLWWGNGATTSGIDVDPAKVSGQKIKIAG